MKTYPHIHPEDSTTLRECAIVAARTSNVRIVFIGWAYNIAIFGINGLDDKQIDALLVTLQEDGAIQFVETMNFQRLYTRVEQRHAGNM
ncbi:hypothetical protein P6F34_gp54 [Pseudomonas phage MiCath]|uniref:Uncharacterized protein n=1 Tax=Pseudomonas phage MiCath TaxID=3003729 RepID=A0AAE9VFI8_9CAUD|nr:hypothetical protein P6F34_gp54 [Pseudomonas phage MiCath]WAX22403.1 hypothetical protein [Pseudomonas phage MiCath]